MRIYLHCGSALRSIEPRISNKAQTFTTKKDSFKIQSNNDYGASFMLQKYDSAISFLIEPNQPFSNLHGFTL